MTSPAQYLDYSKRIRLRLTPPNGATPSKIALREAADIACEALASLAEHKAFWDSVRAGAGGHPVSAARLANSAMLYLPDLLRQLHAPIPPSPDELVASIKKHLRSAEKGNPLSVDKAVDEILALRRSIEKLKTEGAISSSSKARMGQRLDRVGSLCSIAGLVLTLNTATPSPNNQVNVNIDIEGGSTVVLVVPQLMSVQDIKKDLCSEVLWLAVEPPNYEVGP